ncbi:MAG: hypothetical protein PVI23_01465 [Maricaulaceae bacterium]|jgi:hypothetical protein
MIKPQRIALTACAIAAAFLSACSISETIENMVPDDVKAFVAEVEPLVLSADPAMANFMTPDAAATITDEFLTAHSEYLPADLAVIDSKWLGYRFSTTTTTTGSSTWIEIFRELKLSDGACVLTYRLVRTDDTLELLYFNVACLTSEQIAAQQFSLRDKSLAHYVVFGFLIALPVLSLATIGAVWTTRRLKRRILWSLFCLLGIGALLFNWSTGEFGSSIIVANPNGYTLNLAQFQLLSASAAKAPYGPWIFTISFPIGAFLFWIQKARGRLKLKDPDPFNEATN